MRHVSHFLAATALASTLAFSMAPARAETPPDTLIQAYSIDDMISIDPAEVFEFTASEMIGNSYEQIIGYDPENVEDIYGEVAESWEVSEDGRTISFKVREGKQFASGNPITAEDVVFSLTRAVKLDKSPAFLLTQFGLTAENVDEKIRQTGDFSFEIEMDEAYAPTLLLYVLTGTVASVVDKQLAMENEVDGDFGYDWLKTNYAGSGPFTIREWLANDRVVLEKNPNFDGETGTLERVIYRHIPEGSTQRLLLEQGDIDIARDLGPEEIAALRDNPDIVIEDGVKGSLYYLGLNQKNENLAKPEVRQAFKYLINYDEIADTIMKDVAMVHQSFLPQGFLGALEDQPFSYDPEKAKALLAEAGLEDGFTVTMDTRNTPDITAMATTIQQNLAEAEIDLEIIPGDGQQTLTKYRARNHDIYIGQWGPDYQDPHTNASTFAYNPDNSDDAAEKPLAWRNSWEIPELSEKTQAAMLEPDPEKRAEMYRELQREVQEQSPFVIMFQQIENIGRRGDVEGYVIGPSFQDNSFREVTKTE